ncbi:MAG TPA: geranylgeranylglyceryl/heptaprenylglyceryl phosphate synthase [Nitrososphaeraceae archaeon]|jgi:phosphoglycerol geranylgeranyltransferase|nr:geranylgeranylglyceryl/heptaprenylglyceryl phosphate synthase [Nitrososphaeraceae archaeon]
MMEIQSTEKYILNEIKKQKTLCFPLIDSENTSKTMEIAKRLEQLGASAILVGGSSTSDQIELSNFVTELKSNVKIPIILFPGNITGISPAADAILFSSLLNSENPYYITGAQAQGALVVNKHQIEAIPTGYLIVGDGSTAWFIGQARSIPFSKANIAVMYALAALYMGMRFLYLEAGSGASQNIPPEMVSIVRKFYKGILIVGGGINSAETAKKISDAGADIIVIGTMIEREKDWEAEFVNIMKAIRN